MELLAGLSFFWFGVVSAIVGIIFIATLASRNYGWAFILFIALGLFTFITPFWRPAIDYVVGNWLTILEYAGIYLVAGFIWATLAWVIHLHKTRSKYRDIRAQLLPQFLDKQKIQELKPENYEDFRTFMSMKAGNILGSTTISKAILTEQVLFWPIKIVAFFLGDAIRVMVDMFVAIFGNLFGSIKRRMFREFSELEL